MSFGTPQWRSVDSCLIRRCQHLSARAHATVTAQKPARLFAGVTEPLWCASTPAPRADLHTRAAAWRLQSHFCASRTRTCPQSCSRSRFLHSRTRLGSHLERCARRSCATALLMSPTLVSGASTAHERPTCWLSFSKPTSRRGGSITSGASSWSCCARRYQARRHPTTRTSTRARGPHPSWCVPPTAAFCHISPS